MAILKLAVCYINGTVWSRVAEQIWRADFSLRTQTVCCNIKLDINVSMSKGGDLKKVNWFSWLLKISTSFLCSRTLPLLHFLPCNVFIPHAEASLLSPILEAELETCSQNSEYCSLTAKLSYTRALKVGRSKQALLIEDSPHVLLLSAMSLHQKKHTSSAWSKPSRGMRGIKEKSDYWQHPDKSSSLVLSASALACCCCASELHILFKPSLFSLFPGKAPCYSRLWRIPCGLMPFTDMVLILYWALGSVAYSAVKQQGKSGKGPIAKRFWSPTEPAELESTGILRQRWSSEDTGMVEFGRDLPRTEFSDLCMHSVVHSVQFCLLSLPLARAQSSVGPSSILTLVRLVLVGSVSWPGKPMGSTPEGVSQPHFRVHVQEI